MTVSPEVAGDAPQPLDYSVGKTMEQEYYQELLHNIDLDLGN